MKDDDIPLRRISHVAKDEIIIKRTLAIILQGNGWYTRNSRMMRGKRNQARARRRRVGVSDDGDEESLERSEFTDNSFGE